MDELFVSIHGEHLTEEMAHKAVSGMKKYLEDVSKIYQVQIGIYMDNIEWESNPMHIHATIIVERDSQKGIIIGKNGSMIKKVGEAARFELSRLFEKKVHLFLFVKVKENWQEDPAQYADWGLDFNA